MPVTRDVLYDEIWAEPMTTVAARYGVSSSFLTRVCERLNVPRPARGHWAKLKVGESSVRPALPALRPGDESVSVKAGEPRPRVPPQTPKAPEAGKRPRGNFDRSAIHSLVFRSETLFENSRLTDEWREAESGDLVTRLASITHEIAKSAPELARKVEEGNRRYEEEMKKLEAQRREWEREERERRG